MFKWVRKVLRQCEATVEQESRVHVDDFENNSDKNDAELFEKEAEPMTLEKTLEVFNPDFIPMHPRMDKNLLKKLTLCGVILGDISGSLYEGSPYPGLNTAEIFEMSKLGREKPAYDGWKNIELFTDDHHYTDDSVLTIAVYKATEKLIADKIEDEDLIVDIYTEYLRYYARLYPDAGYAAGFEKWAQSDTKERNFSYGNGACMRISGIPVLCDNVDDVIKYTYYSTLPSHSHNEGIKGAVCTAVIYWMLSYGASKNDIIRYIERHYPNDGRYAIHCHTQIADLVEMNKTNPWSTLSVICQTSLAEAVINFMECCSFENCLRNGYRYLCDRDTISAIAGPMAAIFYQELMIGENNGEKLVQKYLDDQLFAAIN